LEEHRLDFFPFNDTLNGIIITNCEGILLGKILRFVELFTTAECSLVRRMPAELRQCVRFSTMSSGYFFEYLILSLGF
jgi:hypothetical protein